MSLRTAVKMSMRPSGRGGPRRVSVDEVDTGLVVECFGRHMELLSSLGSYESKSRTDQPDGKGLLFLGSFVKDVIKISPSCELSIPSIRKACERLVFQEPHINKSVYNNNLWASLRQERITCVLNHARKLKREPDRMRQVSGHLARQELIDLKSMIEKIQLSAGDVPEDGADSDLETLYCPSNCMQGAEASSCRRLRANASDVSVDADGFPKMLSAETPTMPPDPVAPGRLSGPLLVGDAALQASMGCGPPRCKHGGARRKNPAVAEPVVEQTPGSKRKATTPPLEQAWGKMFYKSTNSYGIRQQHGDKRQIFSICKKGTHLVDLTAIADQALAKLAAGAGEDVVKGWAHAKVANL